MPPTHTRLAPVLGQSKEIPVGMLCDSSLLLISSPDCLCGRPSWAPPHTQGRDQALAALQSPGSEQFYFSLGTSLPCCLLSCSCLLWAPPSYFLFDDVQALHNSGSGMGLCGSHAPVTGFLTGNAQCLFGHYHSGCGPSKQQCELTNFCITLSSSSTLKASYSSQYLKPGHHGAHFWKLGQEDCPRPSWTHYETLS